VCSLTAKFALGTSPPLDSDTLTIAASRTLNVQPDQVLVGVTVNTPVTASLQDVINELQGSGITAANLVNAYGYEEGETQWAFTLAIPFAKMGDTLTSLARIQQKVGGSPGQPDLTFSVQGPQASADSQTAQSCSFPALVADAQSQAQKLASAAGITLGPVVSLSEGSPLQSVGFLSGVISFGSTGNFLPNPWFAPQPTPAQPCTLTVQFKLLH